MLEQCYEHLAHSYIGMLNMIVQVTLICFCIQPLSPVFSTSLWMGRSTSARPGERVTPTGRPSPESESHCMLCCVDILCPMSRFTCDECVEGMEFVEAYMRDPLWVAEYTLYLEQNFCVHDQVSQQ